MRTRKRICAAVLTAVFAAVLCLTGCAPRAYELYEGTWEGEDIALGDLEIKNFYHDADALRKRARMG